MADLDFYLSKVPGFNQEQPRFMATLAGTLQPLVDAQTLLENLPEYFDLDTAIGAQLDVVGEWVGRSRKIPVPLQNIWFTFDDVVRGFDRGVWKGPYELGTNLATLDDETYRRLLYAVIAANEWDGRTMTAVNAFNLFFRTTKSLPFVQDNGDMSIVVGIAQTIPSLVDLLIVCRRYLPLKPEAVKTVYSVTSVNKAPIFGFDVSNEYIGGFNQSAWGVSPELIADGTVQPQEASDVGLG